MKKKELLKILLPVAALLLVLAVFLFSVSSLEESRREEGRLRLEDVLRRTAAACYASEGIYPPSLDYMCERYGVIYDKEAYTVMYDVFASNLMPDITVLNN